MTVDIEVPDLSELPKDQANPAIDADEPRGPHITVLHFDEGEEISEGDVLAVISTSFGAAEVVSPISGTIVEIRMEEGDPIEPGEVIAILDPDD